MTKILVLLAALLAQAAPLAVTATPLVSIRLENEVPATVLDRLFVQAAQVWGTTGTELWGDYYDHILQVEDLGGNWYKLIHLDGGAITLLLEEGV